MPRKPLSVLLACLAIALAAGWFVLGPLFYRVPIGLDATAFLWGEPLQALVRQIGRAHV